MCFFCKQKTAYEMRISDWSSDVCSSDLIRARDDASSAARTSALAAGRTAPVAIAPVKYDLGASVGFEKFVTPSLPRGTDLRNLPVAKAPEQEEKKSRFATRMVNRPSDPSGATDRVTAPGEASAVDEIGRAHV